MDELIKQILALPHIILSEDEWSLTSSIMSGLENKTPQAFLSELDKELQKNPKRTFDSKRLDALKQYLPSWFTISYLLMQWMEQIAAVWVSQMLKPLEADHLVPVIMHFLPADVNTLKNLEHRLIPACELDYISRYGCAYNNMLVAVRGKLMIFNSPEEYNNIYPEKLLNKITLLCNNLSTAQEELKRQRQLLQLTRHCNAYKLHLMKIIKNKLANILKQEIYSQYFKDAHKDQPEMQYQADVNAIFDFIEANHTSQNLIEDKATLTLLSQFTAIFDLSRTCERDDINSTNKLLEFGEKYKLLQDILDKDDDIGIKLLKTLTGYVLIERLISWLPESIRTRSAVERFQESTESFADKPGLFNKRRDIPAITHGNQSSVLLIKN